ncbi:MAG: MFS transporter [bacterium]
METTAKKYRRLRARSFIIIWFVYGGYYLTRKSFAVCKSSIMSDLHLNTEQIGWIGGAFLGMYAIGQLLNGMLGDRLGPRVTLSVGMIVSALAAAWFGLTTSLAMMIFVWGLSGYFQSTGWPGSIKSMSLWFSFRERGLIMGVWSTCYQIGGALASALAAFTLSRWGWRSAFFVPAAILLLIATVFILFHKESPEKAGLPPIDEYHNEPPLNNGSNGAPDASIIRDVLSQPMIWLLGACYFCLKFVLYGILFWLPLYMTEKLGYAPAASGYLSMAPEIFGFLGAIFAGFASDKLFGSRRAPVVVFMMVGLAVALFFQTKLCLMGTLPMIAGLSVIGFMLYGPETLIGSSSAMDFGTRRGAATAAGFINFCGSSGAAIQEPLLGYLGGRYGYDHFFHLFIVMTFIPFIIMLINWNVRPGKDSR